MLWDEAHGFSPLSQKTRKSKLFANVITKAALSSQVFKDPECWSGRCLTCRSADRRSPNWANLSLCLLFIYLFIYLFIVCSTYFARTAYRCGLTVSVPVPCAEPRLWLIPSGEMATLQPTLYYFKFSLSCRLKVKNSNYKVQGLGQERIGLAR